MSESNGTLEAKLDVPGMSVEEIEIEVTGDTLTISGRREEEKLGRKHREKLSPRRTSQWFLQAIGNVTVQRQ
ncbi:MAG: Hsp20/alpha crystallin family protein [Rhodopirellula sp.]|nr:Hsp20/alpha crystallin family protein [Rhodopirellula sp.]